ncbi:MAG: anti-sigma factor family protein [Geminicoccaceae bacterium]
MTHSSNKADSALLHAYVDGQLGKKDRIDVEAYLAGDPNALERVQGYQRQNISLHALFPVEDGDEDEMVFDSLRGELAQRYVHQRRVRLSAFAAFACFIVLGAGLVGHQLNTGFNPVERVVAFFPTFNKRDLPTGAEVQAASAETPVAVEPQQPRKPEQFRWFGDQGGETIGGVPAHPPDLQSFGYVFGGGRAVQTEHGTLVRFVYEAMDSVGDPLSITVGDIADDKTNVDTSVDLHSTTLFWRQNGLVYAMSGRIDPVRMTAMIQAITPPVNRSLEEVPEEKPINGEETAVTASEPDKEPEEL